MFSKVLDVINFICNITLKVFDIIALRNKQNEKTTRINKYNDIIDSVFVDTSSNSGSTPPRSNNTDNGVDTDR
jgi:hypothetical protein